MKSSLSQNVPSIYTYLGDKYVLLFVLSVSTKSEISDLFAAKYFAMFTGLLLTFCLPPDAVQAAHREIIKAPSLKTDARRG